MNMMPAKLLIFESLVKCMVIVSKDHALFVNIVKITFYLVYTYNYSVLNPLLGLYKINLSIL